MSAAETAAIEVNRALLKDLEGLGFSMPRAAWALHHSGNSNLETAVNWIIDHENDSQFEKMPLVEFNIDIESPDDIEETSSHARTKELEEEEVATKPEGKREREKERIGGEKDEKKRNVGLRKLEKNEEMSECLRSLRRNHKDEDSRRAFETLMMIVRNVAKNPNKEKYRRVRLTNNLFRERVGRFKEGLEFLELCGFKKEQESEFLYLPSEEADIMRLRDAAFQLNYAITNPFFGLLSKEVQ